jgi:hypothetical protein
VPIQGVRAFRVGSTPEGVVIPGQHGWLFWHLKPQLDVRVKVADVAGILTPVAVVVRSVTGLTAVTGTDLRDLPLGRLAAALTGDEIGASVRSTWTARSAHAFDPDSCTPQQAALIAATTPIEEASPPLALEHALAKGKHRRDDTFYVWVELTYFLASRTSKHPAVDIANANDVPVSTVHRWMKEARRRRKLGDEAQHRRSVEADERDARVDAGLAELGMTWEEYQIEYGYAGSEDPLNAFLE